MPGDIEVVTAFDIDKRKVGKDISEAIFELPNCTTVFCKNVPKTKITIRMGKILDGFSDHMKNYDDKQTFIMSDEQKTSEEDVINVLKESETEILINYLPIDSEEATKFYAKYALESDVAFINNIPVFITSNPEWTEKFKAKNLPIIKNNIKAQIGATITHRVLADLFNKKNAKIVKTYQLNTKNNTDFLNMLNLDRLASKKVSKTETVQSVLAEKLDDDNIHISPSDYVPWQKDNKICFLRIEGKLFGNLPMNLELQLSIEDSPNSKKISIDAIRFCKLALERDQKNMLTNPSAFLMKHPPKQFTDDETYKLTKKFISGKYNTPLKISSELTSGIIEN